MANPIKPIRVGDMAIAKGLVVIRSLLLITRRLNRPAADIFLDG
jgi:hypothetical protein